MVHEETERQGDLVTIAVLVSRVEALCLADMLNAEGVATYIGGYHHASVEVIPLALGDYRLWVPMSHYALACDLIRETGVHLDWSFSRSVQRAVFRMLKLYLAIYLAISAAAALAVIGNGLAPVYVFLATFSGSMFMAPVRPQRSGDYYLSETVER